MINILDLPDNIWDYLFRQGYLKIMHLVILSKVCTDLYYISHKISVFKYPDIDPFDFDSDQPVRTLKKVCVKAWNNVAFIRYFPSPSYGVQPNYHYIFHTWSDCPNVYFHLFSTKWINFDQIIKKFENRIYFYSSSFNKFPGSCNIPYLKLFGNIESKYLSFGSLSRKVSIGFSDIEDLSPFRNLKELIIKFSSNLDLETLRKSKLQKLELQECNIQSIEGVQGIKTIVITGNNRIEDFSPVSKTPYLSILRNSNLRNLDFVKQIKELDISGCSNILDVSYLTQIDGFKKLTAKSCRWAIGFEELRLDGIEVDT